MQVEDKVKKARSPRNVRQEQRIDVTPNIGDAKKIAASGDQSGILEILGLGEGELSTAISSAVMCPQSRVKGVDIVDASHLAFVHHAKEAIQTGATTRFLHILGGLLEDAVLVCLALNLRAVASALRVHNHVCARLAVYMSYDLYQNAMDDLPILNKDWSINYDAA